MLFYIAEIKMVRPGSGVVSYGRAHGTRPHGTLTELAVSLSSSITMNVSDVGYRTNPATDGEPVPYPPMITEAFAIDRSLNLDPNSSNVAAAWGSLTLANENGQYNQLTSSYNNDGRPVSILYGKKTVESFSGYSSNRSTIGTYIGSDRKMATAAARVLRTDYTTGAAVVLNEAAATAVLVNSETMSGFGSNGDSTITAASGFGSPLSPTATIKQCVLPISAAGNKAATFSGFSQTTNAWYVGSVWVYIPSGQTLTTLRVNAEGNVTNQTTWNADVSIRDRWQRIAARWQASNTSTNLVVRIDGHQTVGCTVYACCPMIEVSTSSGTATSYIATAGSSATRAADKNYTARRIMLDPSYSTLQPLFVGIQTPWSLDESNLTIPLRDATYWTERPIQQSQFTGAGSYNGSASLTGVAKPKARGGTSSSPIKNITPVLIDPVNLIYQYSDAPGTVVNLYEGGALTITRQTDTTNLYAGSTNAGQFRTDNSRGLFQLGSNPAGAITLDVTGAFAAAGSQTTGFNIARYLLTEELGLPSANINLASFTAANTACPYVSGYYWDGQQTVTGDDAVNVMLASIGAKLYPGRDGALRVMILRAPTGTPVASFSTANAVSAARQTLPNTLDPPPYRLRIGYQHNYTVQTSGFLGSATQTQIQFAQSADRYGVAASSTILANYSRPNDPSPVLGGLLVQADAQTCANDLITLWGARRRLYQVVVPIEVGILREIGDIVSLTWPVDNLTTGQIGIIVGDQFRSEDATITLLVLI